MAIVYPINLDTFSNPSASDSLETVNHADQHSDVNDAIEALETKVGINSSANTDSIDYKINHISLPADTATKTGVETFTNKTLTAPVINSPTGIVKADVGLSNVSNTSDATKNAATATLTNKTLTSPIINTPSFSIGAVVSKDLDLTDATVAEATGALTNGSWADIGTGVSVTTTQNNQKVLVCFAGKLTTISPGSPYISNIEISITVAGSGQEGTWYARQSEEASAGEGVTQYHSLGFSILVTVATAGATAIKLRGIKVTGTSYAVDGVLSAVVLGV